MDFINEKKIFFGIIIICLIMLLFFGCVDQSKKFNQKDKNFFGDFSPEVISRISGKLGLPIGSDINDIKLHLNISENSSNKELMEVLKDKNIFGGGFK